MEKARVNKIISLLVLVMVCVNNEVRCKTMRDCLNYLCLVGKQVCKNGVCKCEGHVGHENEGRGGIY
ncbi:hypothetical protein DCAR_0831849 [Daucus carota subsp. sativus]|uniref:Uncharacterized protein n=1 Tax=Daucus carota subsp. sativus TaxID=79200 RepID=A0AAF0XS69_DAUCS|nr:hypothetical protein DCAR_0831849 [Daucus carota subsp. sativus]